VHSLRHFLARGMTILKERLIYTAGTFKIDDDLARCRRLIVRASVLRLPFSAFYRNERSNPPKYFLGYVSLFIGNYVHSIFPLEFEQQIVFLWDNLASQIYGRMLCEFINSNSNLVALRVSIPLAGALVPLPADPGTFPGCPYNFIKFKLEPGARILVTGVGEELETCEGGDFETKVPDLEPPPSPFPPDQARDEDPPRSQPEEGELPGDTALPSVDDPESEGAIAGTWTLTYSELSGPPSIFTIAGLSTDSFEIVSPGSVCTLSGSSDLIKNGSIIAYTSFNCNNAGYVSSIISQVFTPD